MENNTAQAQADVANAMPDAIDNDTLVNIGLTSAEVEGRIAEGKVNGMQTIRTKSYAQIFISNIFTFFN
ncbi:MAG: hypothetical protein RSB59_06915, partial [Clostridia bacterium]